MKQKAIILNNINGYFYFIIYFYILGRKTFTICYAHCCYYIFVRTKKHSWRQKQLQFSVKLTFFSFSMCCVCKCRLSRCRRISTPRNVTIFGRNWNIQIIRDFLSYVVQNDVQWKTHLLTIIQKQTLLLDISWVLYCVKKKVFNSEIECTNVKFASSRDSVRFKRKRDERGFWKKLTSPGLITRGARNWGAKVKNPRRG